MSQPTEEPGPRPPSSNAQIAGALEETADLLQQQGANPFRVRAYREGAQTLRDCPRPVAEILGSVGFEALMQLPGIGRSLAGAIEHLVLGGRLPLLERLRGERVPERILATVADIGPKLAARIHEQLGIETLPELAAAAADGRLARVPGMGTKRLRAVRESLAGRFRPAAASPAPAPAPAQQQPDRTVPVAELLEIDREYRRLARQGRLPLIAPRRFNPTRTAWLPVLHTHREDRQYTALYSNTARAHQLGATSDWLVIYREDGEAGGPWTVITAAFGRLRGRRIVRGREDECRRYYASQPQRKRQIMLPLDGPNTSDPIATARPPASSEPDG